MSNDKSRAAFEAWYEKYDPDMENGAPNDFEDAHVYWMQCAWQAYRKVALEEAISAIESANADRVINVLDCVQIIEDLK